MITIDSMRPPSISRRSMLAGIAAFAITPFAGPAAVAQEALFPMVVDLDWLMNRARRSGLRVFDVSPLHVWRAGHIDSAEHAWWRDTVDPNYPVFGAVLTQGDDQRHRQEVLDALGLSLADDVVVYDNASGFRAARLVWFLRFLGVGRAAILNASYDDWRATGLSLSATRAPGDSPIVDPHSGFYLVTTQLLDRLGDQGLQLLDIRTDAERVDDLGGQMPLGQIPGSVRLAWDRLLDESGHLLPVDQLLARTTSAGVKPSRPTVLYGNFGVDAALPWLALTAAGFSDLQTYDRGWAEWSTFPGVPRAPLS